MMKMKKSMKKIYHRFEKWECYKNGFYNELPINNMTKEQAILQYSLFLRNLPLFEENIKKVFEQWKYSCEHFLTNESINRIAWIGQSAMCIYSGLSCFFRSGYYLLNEQERKKANALANNYLIKWVEEHEK